MTPPAPGSKSLGEWLAYIERQHPQAIALGLDRVRTVADAMGLRRPARRVITVAGTNGKGSTVAFIEAIARAAGWRVGGYTSPHVLVYNERVRIDGTDVDDATLVAGFEAVEAARGDTPLTYFEYGTLAALWCMQRASLDLAVLEVGLGGRLDAVNLVDPDVAVITTVDLDHQDWLGNDREVIGSEKAGIARPGKPLVLGEDDPPASVLARAYAIGASAIRVGCDYFFEPVDAATWRWRELGLTLDLPMPTLAAPVQMRNAATAIAAVRALRKRVPREAYAQGIGAAGLPARLQSIPCDGIDVRVDVAHNPQAARELARWLREAPVAGRTWAVFAALGDKDITGIVDAVAVEIDGWFTAALADVGPRALSLEAFLLRLAGTPAASAVACGSIAEALRSAVATARSGDRVIVFGSFHTAAAALRAVDAA
jgi:dihydrofolate synthase / folylpolyglutamate synthase